MGVQVGCEPGRMDRRSPVWQSSGSHRDGLAAYVPETLMGKSSNVRTSGSSGTNVNSFGYFLEALREKDPGVRRGHGANEDPQVRVLPALVQATAPRPIPEVAAASGLPPTLYFQTLDSMQSYGLVRRSGADQGLIEITDRGRELLGSYQGG